MKKKKNIELEIERKLFMEPRKNVRWEAKAVLNPWVIKDDKGITHMFYRAVSKSGISSIGYAIIDDEKIKRFPKPIIAPTKHYERKGVEDPRVTKLGNTYYMLYSVFDGKSARIAYAISKDLKKWIKKGIISPNNFSIREARKLVKIKKYRDKWALQMVEPAKVALWDKDAILFPEKINGEFVMIHRFLPDIQVVRFKRFKDLKSDSFWKSYVADLSEKEDKVAMYRRYHWEGEHIGAGAPPIKTKYGWLLIYHGVEKEERNFDEEEKLINRIKHLFVKRSPDLPMTYCAGAALLDLKNPEREITRLPEPLFSPEHDWEVAGQINNVVFPEGVTITDDRMKIYYGCSDSRIGIAELSLKDLIKKLRQSIKK